MSGFMTRVVSGAAALLLVAIGAGCSSKSGGGDGGVSFTEDGYTVLADGKRVQDDTGGQTAGPECSVSEDCPIEAPICDQFTSTCVECKKNDHCSGTDKPYCNPAKSICVECVMKDQCPSEYQFCLEGTCSDKPCFPNAASCVGNSVHICSADGMDPNYEVISCGDKVCHKGNCLECKPNETSCKDNAVIKCHSDGKSYDVKEACTAPLQCLGGQCMYCYPGDKMCEGNVAMRCNIEGTAWEMVQDCGNGLTCYMGACLSPCAGDIKQNTNAGCEFYAVDLDNAKEGEYDAQGAQFAVIASNTDKDASADVTVTKPDGQTIAATVPPMSLHKFELPKDWGLDGTSLGQNSFKISASRPIVVYQFNPLSNVIEVFSNDASVLLPSPSLGNEYYVMTFKQYETTFRGYFTVIGVSTVPTEVTFTPTCNTLAGGDIPAVTKGQSHTVTLNQGDVLNVESNESGGDLTGTHITANAPIAVFGGHEATNTLDECCADHLEQQMLPVNTWGTHYLVTKTWERWKEKDHVRIMASQDGTQVTLNPSIAQVPTLNAGQFYHFQSNVNIEVTATKPIQVAQYLASSYEILGGGCPAPFTFDSWYAQCIGPSCTNASQCPSGTTCEIYLGDGLCAPIGDPAMMLAVSEEQFMDSYVFLTPDAYLTDYLNVIAPLDAQKVVLDNNQINPSSFVPIGMSGYGVFRTAVADGIHQIWSDKKIGIVVYGYDDDVSYGYPGGMGLLELDL